MGKKPLPTTKHLTQSKILLAFNVNKRCAEDISIELQTGNSGIRKQILHLRDEGYLTADKNSYSRNRIYYEIDWGRVSHRFSSYILSYIMDIKVKRLPNIFLNIADNKYFIQLLKINFVRHYENYLLHKSRLKTIEEYFEEILMQLIYGLQPHHNSEVSEILKNDSHYKKFLRYSEFIERELSYDVVDTIEEFYDGIIDSYPKRKITKRTSKKNN